MNSEFSYLKNRISEYRKVEMLEYCYSKIDQNKNKIFPIWDVLTLIKWSLIYGETKYPYKKLTPEKFNQILSSISKLSDKHIIDFINQKKIDRAFQIIYHQQFYLQKIVYKEIFSTQLKLFSTLKWKYDIEKSFIEKTGFSIINFLQLLHFTWLYINIDKLEEEGLSFNGYLDSNYFNIASEIADTENILIFIKLLTLNPTNIVENIKIFKNKMHNAIFQTMEISLFVMYPFAIWQNEIKLLHNKIFNHTINYYIYDFLKNTDKNFTTEFGHRLEKYIELGLIEIKSNYKNEVELKKTLHKNSPLVDFFVEDENIFIESKAIEMNALPSVNPKDELIYNELKSSLLKAYFKQIVPVSNSLRPNKENWGIIITYKELYWSRFNTLLRFKL
jgi:hypothetical protein